MLWALQSKAAFHVGFPSCGYSASPRALRRPGSGTDARSASRLRAWAPETRLSKIRDCSGCFPSGLGFPCARSPRAPDRSPRVPSRAPRAESHARDIRATPSPGPDATSTSNFPTGKPGFPGGAAFGKEQGLATASGPLPAALAYVGGQVGLGPGERGVPGPGPRPPGPTSHFSLLSGHSPAPSHPESRRPAPTPRWCGSAAPTAPGKFLGGAQVEEAGRDRLGPRPRRRPPPPTPGSRRAPSQVPMSAC